MIATLKSFAAALFLGLALSCAASWAGWAQEFTLELTVENQKFVPDELRAPANRPIVIQIRNNGSVPMEFESVSLRVEKVIAAKSRGSVRIRPLKPGRYEFLDDFHKETKGTLIVE